MHWSAESQALSYLCLDGVCGTRSDYPHSPHQAASNLSYFINSFRAHFGVAFKVKAFSKTAARRESLIQ